MKKYVFWIFLLLVTLFPSMNVQADSTGDYRVEILIDDLDYRLNIATAQVIIEATIPAGTGVIHIPLPFVLSSNGRFLVETEEIGYVVLFGDLRPANRYSVIQISQTDTTNLVTFTLSEVHLQLGDSSLAQANKVLFLLFQEANDRVGEKLEDITILNLREVVIVSSDIESSIPSGRPSGNNSIYTIDFTESNSLSDIICFLSKRQNQFLRITIPFIFGFPLGLLGGMQFIRSKVWAKRTLIGASVALVILVVASIVFYPHIEGLLDNDLLLAFSTLNGSLFGLILISIVTLRTQTE